MSAETFVGLLDTPIGWLRIEASAVGVTSIDFDASPVLEARSNAITQQCQQELAEYFAGQRRGFSVPLAAAGTEFQQSVWRALARIPFGHTCCYRDVAEAIGNPKAVRAVGAANGRNPIPIIVPCHRVIGANQTMVGFSGGLDKKEWLLRHEGALLV
ncbi:Methylated DNA-protein cysteine methyltransferase [gamma proteobacterium HdN1]|nr:Methylated DNA-protein cysteine methyltransferase [gamma proteobacterium HdN1]